MNLSDVVTSVEMNVRVLPDYVEVLVNGEHYASAYRMAGQEALDNVTEVHAIAVLALSGGWTVREMNGALAHLRMSLDERVS